ncbi:hypothetical protein LLR47_10855 [Bacillus cereus]|uniref:nucleotide-binding domain-containing protein n=1 Tax=Bacillus cereus TaxID=1396 RepID=UPI001D13ECCF|nr:hypothetical protein [Bacillus cereus]MCC3685732.1 hypothetical protein [Bacillus cereus]
MFNVHDKLVDFHDNHVKLSESEKTRLRGFKDTNLKRLNEGLKAINNEKNKSYTLVDHVVQGSIAMSTVTQNDESDYDIDVAVIFEKENLPASALDSRKLVEDALLRKCTGFITPPVAGKNAIRIQYQEGYHIDFAVYRRYKNQFDEYEYEHAGPSWGSRHPRGIRDWFNSKVIEKSPDVSNDFVKVEQNQMRRMVRLFKMFCRSRSNWSLPGGVILTTLVEECYSPHNERDDIAFYNTMVNIKHRIIYSNNVNNPTNPSLSLTPKDAHKKKVTRLKDYLEEKLRCLDDLFKVDCDEIKAQKAWEKFFNHSFWNVEAVQKSETFAAKQASGVYPEVYSLNVRYLLYNKTRSQQLTYKKNRTEQQLSPKNCTLLFEAIHNVPAPYNILWEVNNSGDEAKDAGQLYFQTKKNYTEGNYNWESTAFKGTHTMTTSIIKNDMVVAKREIKVRVI